MGWKGLISPCRHGKLKLGCWLYLLKLPLTFSWVVGAGKCLLLDGGRPVPEMVQCHGFFITTWSGTSPGATLLDERRCQHLFFLLICSSSAPWCCSIRLHETEFRSPLFTHSVTLEVEVSILTMSDLPTWYIF